MTMFKGRYRIESARLPGWNYSAAGWYFVTVCTQNHQCLLGKVIDGEMRLSPVGEVVADEWRRTEQARPGVRLDAWCVMPNHFHGIIVIQNDDDAMVETPRRDIST